MFKDVLKKTQPIVYQTLRNGLINNKVAHAYLFHGPKGTCKKEAAVLLAQSIICQKYDFACEECDTCRRIKDMNYNDVIFIDGSIETIKKEQIQNIQDQFSKTALEISQEKIYIINNIENASISSLNSLLKFLEEPISNTITAILIVDNIDNLLPTIVSRCQIIPFRQAAFEEIYKLYIDEGCELIPSYFASYLTRSNDYTLLEDESFQMGMYLMRDFIKKYPDDLDMFLVNTQADVLKQSEKNKDRDLNAIKWFVDMTCLFYQDTLNYINVIDGWYNEEVNRVSKLNLNVDDILLALLNTRDLLNKSFDYKLLLDQMAFRLKGVEDGRSKN